VDGHPHPDTRAPRPILCLQQPLGRDRGGNGARRIDERGEERVAHGLGDVAAVALDGVTHELVVPFERHRHRVTVLTPEQRAIRDIGDEERDCTCR